MSVLCSPGHNCSVCGYKYVPVVGDAAPEASSAQDVLGKGLCLPRDGDAALTPPIRTAVLNTKRNKLLGAQMDVSGVSLFRFRLSTHEDDSCLP